MRRSCVRVPTIKDIMHRTKIVCCPDKHDGAERTRRSSHPVFKQSVNKSTMPRQHSVKRTGNAPGVTKENTYIVKTIANGSTTIGDAIMSIMPRTRSGSIKDFVLKNKQSSVLGYQHMGPGTKSNCT